MATPLDKPAKGCAECRSLHGKAMNARGDMGDARGKLIRAQKRDNEARYVEELVDLKDRVRQTQEDYWAHHAAEHPRQNAAPFANLASKYAQEKAELPPVADMLDMIEDGWTHKQIGEEYGCSQTTVTHRIQASGLAEQRKAARKREARPDGHANRNGGLVDIFNLWDAEWVTDALCAQTDPDSFYPDKGESPRAAKAMCMRCEVRAECLEAALTSHERFGVFGGKTERERRKIIKQREAQARGAAS